MNALAPNDENVSDGIKIDPPPQSLNDELAFLGSLMYLPFEEAKKIIESETVIGDYFYSEKHKSLFSALCKIALDPKTSCESMDETIVGSYLKRDISIDRAGGPITISDAINACCNPKSWQEYARVIRDMYFRREAHKIGRDLCRYSAKTFADLEHLVTDTVIKLLKFSNSFVGKNPAEKMGFEIDLPVIPVFNEAVDDIVCGFYRRQVAIITGDKASGKTSFCLDQAFFVAKELGGNVIIFNGKESKVMLASRMISSHMALPTSKLRRVRSEELNSARKELSGLSIYPICKVGKSSFKDLKSDLWRIRAELESGVDLVVIDCINNLVEKDKGSSASQLEFIISECATMADVFDCVFLVVAEQNSSGGISDCKKIEYDTRQIIEISAQSPMTSDADPINVQIKMLKNEGACGSIVVPMYPYGSFVEKKTEAPRL